MKKESVDIEVKASIAVDKRTAEGCLKLVELYVNQTGDNLIKFREDDGSVTLRFEKRDGEV